MLTNPRSQALVRAIVQLADAMGITTVAEYVESNTVRDRLASLGIQFGQGFALGRPGPLDDVLAAVADRAPEGRERPFTENEGVHHAVRHPDHVQTRVNGDIPHFLANGAGPRLAWPPDIDERLIEARFAGLFLDPLRVSERALTIDAGADCLEFRSSHAAD